MLVAIERSRFNYLFKLNTIPADLNSIYWYDKENLLSTQQNSIGRAIVELDEILPPFEEEHEVILLEYDRMTWEHNDKSLEFSGVLSVIPLTQIGKRLLAGKLNDKIKLAEPFFEKTIEGVKNKRDLKLRRLAAEKLLSLFRFENPPAQAIALMEKAIAQIVKEPKAVGNKENIFHSLFLYNTTERFIPQGNIEYLCKIAVLARIHLGQDPYLVQQGPFYKELVKLAQVLNRKTLIEAYLEFIDLGSESIASTKKIEEVISSGLEFDMLFVAYTFFAFRDILNKKEYDLNVIKADLEKLRFANPIVASIVIYAIGTVFSFDQLYDSIHVLSKAPLITIFTKDQIPNPKDAMQRPAEKKPAIKEYDVSKNISVVGEEVILPTSDDTNENVRELASQINEPSTETKNKETTAYENTIGLSKSAYEGVPVRLFKEFAQKNLPKKGKDILPIVDAYSTELRNGITFKWLNDKLFLSENSNIKKTKLSKKSIRAIEMFFQENRVLKTN